jgi:hypothetical protein
MDPSSSRSAPPAKAATTSDFLSDLSFQLQQEEEELLQMEASLLSSTKDSKIEAATTSAWRPVTIAGISTTKQPAGPDANHKQISVSDTTTKPPAASPVPIVESQADELALLKAELEKQRRQLIDLQQLKTKKAASPPLASATTALDLNAIPSPPETPARCRPFPDIRRVHVGAHSLRVSCVSCMSCVVSCRRTNTASRTTSWPRSTGSRRRCSATWKK